MFSDTFAGIEPSSAPMFIVMQIVGLVAAVVLIRVVYPAGQKAEGASGEDNLSPWK